MKLKTKRNNLQIKSPAPLVRTTAAYGLVTTARGSCAHRGRGWYRCLRGIVGASAERRLKVVKARAIYAGAPVIATAAATLLLLVLAYTVVRVGLSRQLLS